jgi:hypothetical protein
MQTLARHGRDGRQVLETLSGIDEGGIETGLRRGQCWPRERRWLGTE